MILTKEDRILIENLFLLKGYGAKRLIKEFPTKNWKKTTLNDFLKRLRDTSSVERRAGSGRPRTARTDENINTVDELVLSQDDAPQSHHTTRQIAREAEIYHSSIFRIIRQDLRLKCVKKRRAQTLTTANCVSRLTRARQLLRKFLQAQLTSFSSQTRKFSRLLHLLTYKMTASMQLRESRNATFLPRGFFECDHIQQIANGVSCSIEARLH